jgi:hypothetical protein
MVPEPIAFASQKFTTTASKWDTMKKESYAAYFGVRHFAYYLRGKSFLLETDHRNLLWMEKSEVPIIIRWRVFLQSFVVFVRHIAGTKNLVADWLSRMEKHKETEQELVGEVSCLMAMNLGWNEEECYDVVAPVQETNQEGVDVYRWTPNEMFAEIHGGRSFHPGSRKTWLALNARFPGHGCKFAWVEEKVSSCAICQKDRLGMQDFVEPVVRHLKPPHARSRVGVDNLTVTPKDDKGNGHLVVVVDHFTKYVWVYPAASYDATTIATALFVYFCTFGVFEELWSDQGSDLMSDVVKQLTTWLGIKHVFSLVERHESNGVEGSNKQILRHLKTLVHDERMIKKWSDPTILALVLFVMNDAINSEIGARPLDVKFGSDDGPYMRLPEGALPSDVTADWVRERDADLRRIRQVSTAFQKTLADERIAATPAETQNKYQPGDLVLFQLEKSQPLPSKLTSHYNGPYEVLQQKSNEVQVRHLSSGMVKSFHVTRLKLFTGSIEEGKKAALLDADQYVIRYIHNWKNAVTQRKFMQFLVEYADGQTLWQDWSIDLDQSIPYGELIMREPPLFLLRSPAKSCNATRTAMNRRAIEGILPGMHVFVDLRQWGEAWYDQCNLPDAYRTVHVVECAYVRWLSQAHLKMEVRCMVFDETSNFDHYTVYCYGTARVLLPTMTLVDGAYCIAHPQVLPEDPILRANLLRMHAQQG